MVAIPMWKVEHAAQLAAASLDSFERVRGGYQCKVTRGAVTATFWLALSVIQAEDVLMLERRILVALDAATV